MKKTIKSVYETIRRHSSPALNGYWGKIAFSLGGKPFVKKNDLISSAKFPNGEKGGMIISVDFEMAWAWRYTKSGADHLEKARIERKNFPEILDVLELYNIPVTFATVGHLFLENCRKGDHDWMARIPYFNDHWKFTEGDWYDHDPYSDYQSATEWYAPDLIRMITESKVNHEIGSHSFSHIDLSYKNCPVKVAEDEIKACIDIARKNNVDIKSFVFPGGMWGNIEVLKSHGIEIYRRHIDFDMAYPYRDEHGLLVTPTSGALEFNTDYGWSVDYFIKRLKKYLDKAIETNTIAHFWFHPSLKPVFIHSLFPGIFGYANEHRNKGNLWIGTMADIASHINKEKII